jgi:class I fructose-bisphosphate aldolase
MTSQILDLLGDEAESLINHTCTGIPKEMLHLPGPDYVDRVMVHTDRPVAVLRNMQTVLNTGRLGGTGHPARGPGHRALGWGFLRTQPHLL